MTRRQRIPGEYHPLSWDGDGTPAAHYVTGHVTDEQFRAAIVAYHGDCLVVPPDAKIQQVYVRSVQGSSADLDYREWRYSNKGRGAWPMTVWEIEEHRGSR